MFNVREQLKKLTYERLHDDFMPRGVAVDDLAEAAKKLQGHL